MQMRVGGSTHTHPALSSQTTPTRTAIFKRTRKTSNHSHITYVLKRLYARAEISESCQAESLHLKTPTPHARPPEANHAKSQNATRPADPEEVPSNQSQNQHQNIRSAIPTYQHKGSSPELCRFLVFFGFFHAVF
jgi:hypothetical protein